MTRLREKITTPTPIDVAFEYTADFDNIEDWDPGVAESSRIGEAEVGLGAQFDVVATFKSRRIPMVYTITEYDPPRRVVLLGKSDVLTAVDEIVFSEEERGTAITYTADLRFRGIAAWFVPFMRKALTQIGVDAVAGLERALLSRTAPPQA